MATATTTTAPNSLIGNFDVDVGGGQLGEFIAIDTNADFSIVPLVAPQNLKRYYTHYSVKTELPINITLPDVSLIRNGWRCKISMISETGAGSITVKNSSNVTVAYITSNVSFGKSYGSVKLIALTGIVWSVAYGLPKVAKTGQIYYSTGYPAFAEVTLGRYFSFCDTALGAAIDVNTLTPTALRWINPTGRTIDAAYYNIAAASTQVQVTVTGNFRYSVFIGVVNAGGATQSNIQIFPRINGVTLPTGYVVTNGTVQNYTDGVYTLEGAYRFTANDYLEIMMDKSIVSAGTNPVDLVNTCISLYWIS
jgi:hypothetical protein